MLGLAFACSESAAPPPASTSANVMHESFFVFDLHIDSIFAAWFFDNDIGKHGDTPQGWMPWVPHADLPRMEIGGLNGALFGLVVTPGDSDPIGTIEAQLDFAEQEVFGRFPDRIVLAKSTDDFVQAKADGKIAAWLSLEGAHTLGGTLEHFETWVSRGVRSITMAHFTSNNFAASNADPSAQPSGLSALGRRLVCEANRLGVVLDVAHTHPDSLTETVALSRAPVIVSHTGIASVTETFRNLGPEHIALIRDKGGVVGILFATNWTGTSNNASDQDIVDHMDAVRAVGGIESLAIGTDYDGVVEVPAELADITTLPSFTETLTTRGYSQADLAALWGENILRVFREVEAVAIDMQTRGENCEDIP